MLVKFIRLFKTQNITAWCREWIGWCTFLLTSQMTSFPPCLDFIIYKVVVVTLQDFPNELESILGREFWRLLSLGKKKIAALRKLLNSHKHFTVTEDTG